MKIGQIERDLREDDDRRREHALDDCAYRSDARRPEAVGERASGERTDQPRGATRAIM